MAYILPELKYKKEELEPILSRETLDFHYGKHHQTYINNLNNLILGSPYEDKSIEEIIKTAGAGPIFNNAAQVYNHSFYWNCLYAPKDKNLPSGHIVDAIDKDFSGFDKFKEQFGDTALKHFGSGWVWLVKNNDNKLEIISLHDAASPLTDKYLPLLTIDVWEHAYYIDYRNNRAEYIKGFWQLINWEFVEQNLAKI